MRAESVTWGNRLLDLIDSVRMKELRTPVPDIEQPEKYCAYHGHGQKVTMMLGQRETDDC
jgi:hypothetical protein